MIVSVLAAAVFAGQTPDLSVWRRPDDRQEACASCHSPDGIELATFRFADADVTRRAARHMDTANQSEILSLLEKQRARFVKPVVFDPIKNRPHQPGGAQVDGDAGFAVELNAKIPTLMGTPIESLVHAQKARDEMLGVDLRELKVGFPMSRLSEDGFHGEEHATMAQWLPDTAMTMTPAIYEAQDEYLAKPTLTNLRALDERVMKANLAKSPIGAFSLQKYRSMLALQHHLRVKVGWATQDLDRPLGKDVTANPFWQVADFARVYGEMGIKGLGLPPSIAATKTQDISKQMKALRLPWYWMGWLEDPALSRSGLFPETQTGQYFVQTLVDEGPYPLHALFAVTRRMTQLGFDKASWNFYTPQHFEVQYSAFAVINLLKRCPRTPAFETLLANSLRMSLYLLVEDLEQTKHAIRPESQAGQIRFVLTQTKGLTDKDKQLADKALKLLASATRESSR